MHHRNPDEPSVLLKTIVFASLILAFTCIIAGGWILWEANHSREAGYLSTLLWALITATVVVTVLTAWSIVTGGRTIPEAIHDKLRRK